MTKQEWIVVGIAGALIASVSLLLSVPWRSHREPGIPRHRIDMQCIQIALLAYHNEFRQWPDGDTISILRTLRGENPRQIKFLDVNDKAPGVMRDAWGTPYRIQILSNTIVTASAGPNCRWGDADDLEMRKTEPEVAPYR